MSWGFNIINFMEGFFVGMSVSAGGSANITSAYVSKTDSGERLQQVRGSDEHVSSAELI